MRTALSASRVKLGPTQASSIVITGMRFASNRIRGDFSEGGDSGSAVMDHNNNIVGLLFGGGR